jgi:cytochrome c
MRRFFWFLVLLLAAPALAQDLTGHGGPVRAVLPLPDEQHIVSASFDHAVILWDARAGQARAVARWHRGSVNALALLPDGRIASAGEGGRIALWAPGLGAEPAQVLEGHTGQIAALAARGENLASAAWDGSARLWNLADGSAKILEGHRGNVNAVAFRADGTLVSAGFDGTIRLWAADGSNQIIAEAGLPLNALIALPDGGLAAGGVDGILRLIAANGAMREVEAGARPIVALSLDASGARLAVASLGGNVTIWGLEAARLLHTLEGPGLPVWSLAFAPDGRLLWTGGADRQVRRWNALSGRAIGPIAAPAAENLPSGLDAHGAQVFRACSACHALTPDAGPMAGPHLHGIFGRRMGTLPGYAYSERLARGDIIWDAATIGDLFTRGPDVVTPGTKMPVQRVDNADDLAALLRFLEQATR